MTIEELTQAFMAQLQDKDEVIRALLSQIESLEKTASEQAETIRDLNQSVKNMSSELGKLRRMLFDTNSEKMHDDKGNDEEMPGMGCSATESKTQHTADGKKRTYKRPVRRTYENIEADKVIELKPDSEDIKGAKLLKVSHSYRFYYIPGKICKVRIDRYIYHKDGHLITPPLPYSPESFERRHLDPSLAAWLLTAKFNYHLPYERILKMINRSSPIQIAKSTLFDWATAGIDALDGLYEALRRKVLSDWHLNIDETVQRLLDTSIHKCRNVYDWGLISKTHRLMYFKTYRHDGEGDVRDGSRGQEALDEEIRDFGGTVIQSDGYRAYGHVGKRTAKVLENLFCMAHIRRKFYDALSYSSKYAKEALRIINSMYDDERVYKEKNLTPVQIARNRLSNLRPKLDELRKWLLVRLNAEDFLGDDYIGKAIRYAWERIDSFYLLMKHGELELDNNLAERTMRGHTIGRKNYLFCRNAEAVERTCKIYSIIESCKLCKIDPYKYLCEVLSREPKFGETWDDLLPCNIKMS